MFKQGRAAPVEAARVVKRAAVAIAVTEAQAVDRRCCAQVAKVWRGAYLSKAFRHSVCTAG